MIDTCSFHPVPRYRDGRVVQEMGGPGSAPDQCDFPPGVTTDNMGQILVADCYSHRVQVLGQDGSVIREVGTSKPGKPREPLSVAVHPITGDIYVASMTMSAVIIYTPSGRYTSSITRSDIPDGAEFQPSYVTFRSDGLLCV